MHAFVFFLSSPFIPTTLDYGNFNENDFFFCNDPMTLTRHIREGIGGQGYLKKENFSICFVVQRQRENLQKNRSFALFVEICKLGIKCFCC